MIENYIELLLLNAGGNFLINLVASEIYSIKLLNKLKVFMLVKNNSEVCYIEFYFCVIHIHLHTYINFMIIIDFVSIILFNYFFSKLLFSFCITYNIKYIQKILDTIMKIMDNSNNISSLHIIIEIILENILCLSNNKAIVDRAINLLQKKLNIIKNVSDTKNKHKILSELQYNNIVSICKRYNINKS